MTPLYRPPVSKLKAQGKRANRRAAFEAQAKRALLQRIGPRPCCASCGQGGIELTREHCFGRAGTGARLGFPWSELPELSEAVCAPCNTAFADGQEQSAHTRLRLAAIHRFVDRGMREGWLPLHDVLTDWPVPVDARDWPGYMRRLVELAESRGGRDIVLGLTERGNEE